MLYGFVSDAQIKCNVKLEGGRKSVGLNVFRRMYIWWREYYGEVKPDAMHLVFETMPAALGQSELHMQKYVYKTTYKLRKETHY